MDPDLCEAMDVSRQKEPHEHLGTAQAWAPCRISHIFTYFSACHWALSRILGGHPRTEVTVLLSEDYMKQHGSCAGLHVTLCTLMARRGSVGISGQGGPQFGSTRAPVGPSQGECKDRRGRAKTNSGGDRAWQKP